jgi:SAM-dependent methyltransferase
MATDRLRAEMDFHDRQAQQRAAVLLRRSADLRFTDAAYLDHESWIRPAFALLGDLHGKHFLDFGCGHGMAAVVLARGGARVTAFDLSPGYLAEASARAAASGLTIDFLQADGAHLPFADAVFDGIWGNAILHHLDLAVAAPELHRVLKPGGAAVFCEPWDENPLLNWARARLPYPGKHRTADEVPLRRADLRILQCTFPDLHIQGYQLLSMLRRVLRAGSLTRQLERCDGWLLSHLPGLQRFCRYVVLSMRRCKER